MWTQLRISCVMLLVMTLLTGLIYPFAITGVAQLAFAKRANGSLIERNGKVFGSELIGQTFNDPKYFWGRPSATLDPSGKVSMPYNAAASSGSNLAVTNQAQLDAVKDRVAKLHESGVPANQPIPVDLVTASGSGLDPHISVAAARIQVSRVAKVRGMSESAVQALVEQNTEGRQFGIFGEPRVNVLQLNVALDDSGARK